MFPTRFSLAEILVLAGTTGTGGMAPPTSTRIPARLKFVQGHVSRVSIDNQTPIGAQALVGKSGREDVSHWVLRWLVPTLRMKLQPFTR